MFQLTKKFFLHIYDSWWSIIAVVILMLVKLYTYSSFEKGLRFGNGGEEPLTTWQFSLEVVNLALVIFLLISLIFYMRRL